MHYAPVAPPPAGPVLADRFGRRIDYVRISVTDRCDLRCSYCIPKDFHDFEEPRNWLSFDDIVRVVAAFAHMGTGRFRLTGGEPLLRRHLPELIARMAALPGVSDISLTTNGTQLARHARALRDAGLHRLNVSLDSLRSDCVRQITGSNSLDKVLASLQAARDAGFERIKINMVPLQGINDGDVDAMVAFCIDNGFVLRLIEAMPLGKDRAHIVAAPLPALLQRLQQRFALQPLCDTLGAGPARYWSDPTGRFTLGLITPLSQHFCDSCNRVRLSADGTLYMCLGQEASHGLRSLLRAGCSDAQLQAAIRQAIELKPRQHHFNDPAAIPIARAMSQTGG